MLTHKISGNQPREIRLSKKEQPRIQNAANIIRETVFTSLDIGKIANYGLELFSGFVRISAAANIPPDAFVGPEELTIWAVAETGLRLWHASHHASAGIKKLIPVIGGTCFFAKKFPRWFTDYCCNYINYRAKHTRENI